MSVTMETAVSTTPLPLPVHFSCAEQSFSLKKRHLPFSSSSTSASSFYSPAQLSHSLPPRTPSKGCPPVSRLFPPHPSPWTPLSRSLVKSPPPATLYDPNKQQSYFSQCFTNLGLLGRGSFGEVYKVLSHKDRRHYAVKRSVHRFRSNSERNRIVKEARNHERLSAHPHILSFVAAWEECGRLYIQTELCCTSLLLHAENQPPSPDEPAAWAYLCDLLSALQHLHSHGFVHLDLKPANVFLTHSGRLKLGDFGLLLEISQKTDSAQGKGKEDLQEGDPRYMAPELLRGQYGPAADVFSLGVSILELACNIEVPNGGDSWQQLRQGCLPSEFTNALSTELQTVLQMMLVPEPSERATVKELLSLPSVRRRRWRRCISLFFTEAMLALTSLCQLVVCAGWRLLSPLNLPFLPRWTDPVPCTPPKDNWEKDLTLPLSVLHADPSSPEDDGVFLQDPTDPELSPTFLHRVKSRLSKESTSTPLPASPTRLSRLSPAHTPICSGLGDWPSRGLANTPSSIHPDASFHTLTPSLSPIHTEPRTVSPTRRSADSRVSASGKSSQRRGRNWARTEEALPVSSFEPKNLLSLFEETALEGQP